MSVPLETMTALEAGLGALAVLWLAGAPFLARYWQHRPQKPNYKALALRDPLTGLANRRAFDAALSARLARPAPTALALIDLDGFKALNDHHGHSAGDATLCAVAKALQDALHPGEIVARLGGDEFVALGYGADQMAFAQRLFGAVSRTGQAASIGVALSAAGSAGDATELLAAADAAMFEVKSGGGNGVSLSAAPGQPLPPSAPARAAADLPRAIAQGEVTARYTPQIATTSSDIGGFSLSPHWQPEGAAEAARPDAIFAAATKAACTEALLTALLLPALRSDGWPAARKISLALPADTLSRPQTARILERLLAQTGFPPRNLTIVVEAAMLARPANLDTARDLHALGCALAIGGFGAGQAPLAALSALPITSIHLAGNLIARLPGDQIAAATLAAVIAFARARSLSVVATDVATAAQRRALLIAGCTAMQGPAFSAPLSHSAAQTRLLPAENQKSQSTQLTLPPPRASVGH